MILAINGMESATMAAGWALEEIGVSPVGYLEIGVSPVMFFGDRRVSGNVFWR